ncbi:hypothetical protein [Aeromonas bestiarum]|uniref:hypothetical protein n=1 Tax=Aeromonas bestiarum TaxID=105751 RepID=UPI0012EEAF9A|nr:hypothetical protein [Aeromonas bestiarum]
METVLKIRRMHQGPRCQATQATTSLRQATLRRPAAFGLPGAYDSVQRFVRDYKQLPAKVAAFVPLLFAAGKAYQFDWSEEEVEIGGVVQRVKAAHFRLTHSRQPFVMVSSRATDFHSVIITIGDTRYVD